jgi:hypothetical protein
MKKEIILTILAVVFVTSCASAPAALKKGSIPVNIKNILIAEPVLMSSILGINDKESIFAMNLYCGGIQFSGGYIEKPDNGMLRQSANRSYSGVDDFSKMAKKFLSETVTTALNENGYSPIVLKNDISSFIKVRRDPDLMKNEDDEKDNICLPRYQSSGVDIGPILIPENMKSISQYLIIPVIENYYGHSGGFFNGQSYGCGAGARITVFILCINTSNGEIVMVYSDYVKKMYEYKFRINNYEMQQELQLLEKQLSKKITKNAFSY